MELGNSQKRCVQKGCFAQRLVGPDEAPSAREGSGSKSGPFGSTCLSYETVQSGSSWGRVGVGSPEPQNLCFQDL